jgi:hypothetical protein
MLPKTVRAIRSIVDNSAARSARNILHHVRRKEAVRNTVAVALRQAVAASPGSRSAAIVKVATNIVPASARKATSGVSARVNSEIF